RHGARDAHGRAEIHRVHPGVARRATAADRHGAAYSGTAPPAELHRLSYEVARGATGTEGDGPRDAHGRPQIHRVHPGVSRRATAADRHGAAYSGRAATAELHRIQYLPARGAPRTYRHGSRDAHGRAEIHRVHPGISRRATAANGDG